LFPRRIIVRANIPGLNVDAKSNGIIFESISNIIFLSYHKKAGRFAPTLL